MDADYCARDILAAVERGELVGEPGLVARLEGAVLALEALGEVQPKTEVVAERAQSGQSRRLTMREVCSMRWWRVPILVLVCVTASCGGAGRRSAAQKTLADVNLVIERVSRDLTVLYRPPDLDARCRDRGSAIEPSEEWAFRDPQSVEDDAATVVRRLKAMGWAVDVQPEAPAGDTLLVRRLNGIGASIGVMIRDSPRQLAVTGVVDYRFC